MVFNGTEVINVIIAVVGILSSANMLLILLTRGKKDKTVLTYMVWVFIFLLAYNICLLYFVLLQKGEGVLTNKYWTLGVILSGFGTYLFAVITAFIVSSYVAYLVKPPERSYKRIQLILSITIAVFLVILFSMQFTGNLVQFDEAGKYTEGSYYYIGHAMVAYYLLVDMSFLIRFRKNISASQRRLLSLYIGLPVMAIVLRFFVEGVFVVALSSSLSVSLFMILSAIEQGEEYRQQELKNEQLKVDILLGQIQPHFMFNVLYVIQEICHIDPEKASEAIGEFSKYLRHNMDSLSINTPIPFIDELEHTKHFVSLQQLRFGEALVVKYELACIDFYIPTLTLQPIVENAVRYGVRKTSTGEGTVIIRTKERPDNYEVEVIDNGPGFDPNETKEDGLSHTGLNNVRERLRRISGGTLEIWSEQGKGTIVTVVLPKKR